MKKLGMTEAEARQALHDLCDLNSSATLKIELANNQKRYNCIHKLAGYIAKRPKLLSYITPVCRGNIQAVDTGV